MHDTLQTINAVTNEAPWQCASLQHHRLLQLMNGVKLPAVVDSLMHGHKWRNSPDLNLHCWGTCPAQCRQHSHAAGMRCLAQYAMTHRPAAEVTRGAVLDFH